MPSAQPEEAYARFLADRRQELLDRIGDAAQRAGRDPSEVLLLAVSKTVGPDEVAMAYQAGYRAFGENRPQELKRKVTAIKDLGLPQDLRFDMIGNLQKNKINQVLGCAHLIHSVSSQVLAESISQRAERQGVVARCLVEVNVSGEASKSGFVPAHVPQAFDAMMQMPGISLEGLMTMAPARDADAARATFSGLRELRESLITRTGLELPVLSCGMSGDFQIAVEEGATLVRLGRIVFDPAFKYV